MKKKAAVKSHNRVHENSKVNKDRAGAPCRPKVVFSVRHKNTLTTVGVRHAEAAKES